MNSSFSNNKRETRYLLLILLAGVILRLYHLNHQSLWLDEIMRIRMATGNGFLGLLLGNYQWDSQPPVFHLLLKIWSLFGDSDGWFRLFPALTGVATIPFLYILARQVFGVAVALWAAILLAISPFHLWHSQDVNMYALVMFFSVSGTYLLIRFLTTRSRGWAVLFIVNIVLGLYTHFYYSAFILAANVYVFCTYKKYRLSLLEWLIWQGVAFLLVLPSLYYFFKFTKQFVAISTETRGFSPAYFVYAFFVFLFGYSFGPSVRELHQIGGLHTVLVNHWPELLIGAALVFGVILIGYRKFLRLESQKRWFLASFILVPVIFVFLGNLFVFPKFNVRYLSASFPFWTLLMAICLSGWRESKLGKLVVIAYFMVIGWSLGNHYFVPNYANENARASAQFIAQRKEPGDVVVVSQIKESFAYYYGDSSNVFGIYGYDKDKKAKLAGICENAKRIWFVYARPWETDPDGRLLAWLRSLFSEEQQKSFAGIDVFLFSKP